MFLYGLLTGFVIGVVVSVALLFIFASARIASRQDAKEKQEQITEQKNKMAGDVNE